MHRLKLLLVFLLSLSASIPLAARKLPSPEAVRTALLAVAADVGADLNNIRGEKKVTRTAYSVYTSFDSKVHILPKDNADIPTDSNGLNGMFSVTLDDGLSDGGAGIPTFKKWQALLAKALPEARFGLSENYRPEWGDKSEYFLPGKKDTAHIILSRDRGTGTNEWAIRLYVRKAHPLSWTAVTAFAGGNSYYVNAWMDERSMLEGTFAENRFTGRGTYIWANGTKYTGEFENGVPHGTGTLIKPGRRDVEGTFKKGALQDGDGFVIIDHQKYACRIAAGEVVSSTYKAPKDEDESAPSSAGTGQVCSGCDGKGTFVRQSACMRCAGSGYSGTGSKTYDSWGRETGYKKDDCTYCISGLTTKYETCKQCRGRGRN